MQADLVEAERYAEQRKMGETLTAYFAQVPRYAASVTLPDPADPSVQFGSRVTYRHGDGSTRTVTLTGEDEADPAAGRIAWTAPVARALTGATAGGSVTVTLRGQPVELEILAVDLPPDSD